LWFSHRYAFAETDCAEMVLRAKEEMDDKEIEGRRLKVRGTKVRAPEYKNDVLTAVFADPDP
jgi:hypothetical protein